MKWIIWICWELFASCVELAFPPSPPMHSSSDIDHLSDEEVIKRPSLPLDHSSSHFGAESVKRISGKTVVKLAGDREEDVDVPSEAIALQIIAQQTTIPVPHVRRIMHYGMASFAMEYIPGRQLASVWPSLSWFSRLRIALTIRSYVRQLRKIRHPRSAIPGPLGGPADGAKICESPLFGQIVEFRGPFETRADFIAFLNSRWAWSMRKRHITSKPVSSSQRLVLTHQDLNPRNFILGDDGRLWLIDFTWCGFYPEWFEFVAMHIQAENEENLMQRKDPAWEAMIPFVCGWQPEWEKWYDEVGPAFCAH